MGNRCHVGYRLYMISYSKSDIIDISWIYPGIYEFLGYIHMISLGTYIYIYTSSGKLL